MQSSTKVEPIISSLASLIKQKLLKLMATGQWRNEYAQALTDKMSSRSEKEFLSYLYGMVVKTAMDQGDTQSFNQLIVQDDVIRHLDHKELYDYALQQSEECQLLVIGMMIKNPPTSTWQWSLQPLFSDQAGRCFQQLELNGTYTDELSFVQKCLKNPYAQKHKTRYLREWINFYLGSCGNALKASKYYDRLFYEALPQEPDIFNEVLEVMLTKYISGGDYAFHRVRITTLLQKFQFDSNSIIDMLELDYNTRIVPHYIDILIKYIAQDHPKYERYKLVADLMALSSEQRCQFLLDHQVLLDEQTFTALFRRQLIYEVFQQADYKFFIEWSIDHPEFAYGSNFCDKFANYTFDISQRYLSAPHTKLPDGILALLLSRTLTNELATLLQLLFKREDCSITMEDLAPSLLKLFSNGNREAIDILLAQAACLNILKKYYVLRGDNCLRMEEHGTLMPSVLAWYAQTEYFSDVYGAYDEIIQNRLLKGYVHSCIHLDRLSLKSFIIQMGKPEAIATIGGSQPRLMNIQPGQMPIAYMPHLWQNMQTRQILSQYQRRFVTGLAEQRAQLYEFDSVDHDCQDLALTMAENHTSIPLQLLHETYQQNFDDILVSNRLQTRHHLQQNIVHGKQSRGLTSQRLDSATNPHGLFCFFTLLPANKKISAGLKQFSSLPINQKASFVLDLFALINHNPQIRFIIIGATQYLQTRELVVDDGIKIVTRPDRQHEGTRITKITFDSPQQARIKIYQHLFERVLKEILDILPKKQYLAITQRLLHPNTPQDQQLAADLIDLLQIEWLLPGDVPLNLNYIDYITSADQRYDLTEVKRIINTQTESEIVHWLTTNQKLASFPFVRNNIMNTAISRGHGQILAQLSSSYKDNSKIKYYPVEVYQIESLMQLILEDHNNDRVYLRYHDNCITLFSILQKNTNINCAHHASMAHLHQALGLSDLTGGNALQTNLSDTLTIKIGPDERFISLAALRDALLTYELTTVCTSYQNNRYYYDNRGQFHHLTGKGATNGTVSLLPQRLFVDNQPYRLTLTSSKTIKIWTNIPLALTTIKSALHNLLGLSEDQLSCQQQYLEINLPIANLIALLRRKAIFYEGINVLTKGGKLLLAHRHGKGLASAGGHHGDRYDRHGCAHGLLSEFGLAFRQPQELADNVSLLEIKPQTKTAIYIVSADSVHVAKKNCNWLSQPVDFSFFQADRDEFVPGSETILSLSEMRGKEFYQVMPLAELANYQLSLLRCFLKEQFDGNVTASLNDEINLTTRNNVTYKCPGAFFGRINLYFKGELPDSFLNLIASNQLKPSTDNKSVITDESPMMLIEILRAALVPVGMVMNTKP